MDLEQEKLRSQVTRIGTCEFSSIYGLTLTTVFLCMPVDLTTASIF